MWDINIAILVEDLPLCSLPGCEKLHLRCQSWTHSLTEKCSDVDLCSPFYCETCSWLWPDAGDQVVNTLRAAPLDSFNLDELHGVVHPCIGNLREYDYLALNLPWHGCFASLESHISRQHAAFSANGLAQTPSCFASSLSNLHPQAVYILKRSAAGAAYWIPHALLK